MPTRLDARSSLAAPIALRGRKLFSSGGGAQPSSPSTPSVDLRHGKPRSATISIFPGSRRVASPLLPIGWFGRGHDDDASGASRPSPSPNPAGSCLSCSVGSNASSCGSILTPPDSPEVKAPAGERQQHDTLHRQIQGQQQQQAHEKTQRRRRSFFFKKRKGGGYESDDPSATAPPPPPLPPSPLRARPVMSAKELETRRLQDEQNLAALEKVSDLVCQSVDLATPPPSDRRRGCGPHTRLASSSYASLVSPPMSDGEERFHTPSLGGSNTLSSEGGWMSDTSEAFSTSSPPRPPLQRVRHDQSVLDQILLPSSMKSIKRERRKQAPPTLIFHDVSAPAFAGPAVGATASRPCSGRASMDDMTERGRLFHSTASPSWIRDAFHGPAPPPRPGRSNSQRHRTASLSMPPRASPSRPQPIALAPRSPECFEQPPSAYRSQLSTISSNSSSEELSAAAVGMTQPSRSRASMSDIAERPPTRQNTADGSPFSTPTFGHDAPWCL